jgi:outer membrane receptor protein involved in Fe transport
MKSSRWILQAAVCLTALLGAAGPLAAQSVSTGAISGTVSDQQDKGMQGVQVQAINRLTGARSGTLTNDLGRYYISALETGGPYTVSIRRIGFAPRDTNNLYVSLGENLRVDFSLAAQATKLSGVEVVATTSGAVFSSSHTGIETTITDSSIARLPTLNRNFTDFVSLSPQVSTKGPGLSGGGQNNRFNAIQIDGAVGNDMFGLSSTLQPGGLANAKQVSIEAIKEYQILLSPFDVRQGNFTGFLVNAVTKSGSNEFHSTGTYATRNQDLERNVPYLRSSPFNQSQEGFWMGGPIIKDKLLFSIAPEFQQQSAPATTPYIGQPTSQTPLPPATQAAVDSFVNILKTKYNFANPGTGAEVTNKNPLSNMFARFDLINLPENSRLVARYNYVGANQDISNQRSTTRLALTNNGYTIVDNTNSGLAQLFSDFTNGSSNEFTLGYTKINDVRSTPIEAPFVVISRVSNPNGGTGQLSAGTENSSQGNELNQGITEIGDNFTVPWQSHRFTIGTKDSWYTVRNLFSQNSLGNFTFGTLDSLMNDTPSSATLGIKLDNTDGAAHFNARTLSFYGEDEWQARDNLSVVGGVRLDMPGLTSNPGLNTSILNSSLAINTTQVPHNVMQWSPRIGFNWDVTGDQVNQIRGGTGAFTGQPAYVWLSDLFGNSGVNGYGNLSCTSMATAPAMQVAGGQLAGNCKGSTGSPAVTVNTTDPNLKFPETWRSSIGYDRRLPWNIIGTIEAMYTRSIYNFYYQNIGITPTPIGTDLNGREIYGDITSATGNPVPVRPAGVTGDVIAISNTKTHDYSYSITPQIVKRFSDNFEGELAYTYGRSYDVYDLTSSVAFSNWEFGRSYSGRQDAQDLYPSKWDVPHRLVASGEYTFPTKTGVSLTWVGESGVPYEYVYTNDMNGDNTGSNDLIYVPTNAHDTTQIRFTQNGNLTPAMQADSLEKFIASHACLNSQRGTIMKRNSCRSPWDKVVNLSARQTLPSLGGKNLILQLDIFNFLNLLNKNWGSRDFGSTNSPGLLTRRSYVAAPGQPDKIIDGAQPVFIYNIVNQFTTQNIQSNYALQLQVKYSF